MILPNWWFTSLVQNLQRTYSTEGFSTVSCGREAHDGFGCGSLQRSRCFFIHHLLLPGVFVSTPIELLTSLGPGDLRPRGDE